MDVVLDRIARLPNTSGVLLLSKTWLPIGSRGALAESDAETIERILSPWTSAAEDNVDDSAESGTESTQSEDRLVNLVETLPSSGKVPWGDDGGHIHFHRTPSHTLVLLKHPPKPNIIHPPTPLPHSFFPPSPFQPGNLTTQARLLGFRRSSGQSTPTVVARRSLFGAALEVPSSPSLVDPSGASLAIGSGATAGLGPAGALSAPGSSSSLETVRAVTSSSSLRTSRFVPRSYSSR